MTVPDSRLVCAGCGASVPPEEPFPFRCPRYGTGDADHVLARQLELTGIEFPIEGDANPFIRFRELSHSWSFARRLGMSDGAYVGLVRELSDRVAEVDGRSFEVTPYERSEDLTGELDLGALWIKDETGNAAGSHKARHLMGIALQIRVAERVGLVERDDTPLAVASCGNAALAAAVIAKALGRSLRVFVPVDADAAVIERLGELGARLVRCERTRAPGDPCYRSFLQAVARGAVPFGCQGNENALAIDGGQTLGFEILAQHAASGAGPIDRIVIQVGGGALSSSTIQAMQTGLALGVIGKMPWIDVVQTRGSHPLERAFERLVDRADASSIEDALRHAARHRSAYMWPWETGPGEKGPVSIASGILDDEAYDWLVIVRALYETGGSVVIAGEEALLQARDLARSRSGIGVSATGAAGLAGLLELESRGGLNPEESVVVLFTGSER
ncbi:MAG: pyridoxal-phosphate dependent enzyme [Planctomycetota bacterium]